MCASQAIPREGCLRIGRRVLHRCVSIFRSLGLFLLTLTPRYSYDIFAINIVSVILGYLYGSSKRSS